MHNQKTLSVVNRHPIPKENPMSVNYSNPREVFNRLACVHLEITEREKQIGELLAEQTKFAHEFYVLTDLVLAMCPVDIAIKADGDCSYYEYERKLVAIIVKDCEVSCHLLENGYNIAPLTEGQIIQATSSPLLSDKALLETARAFAIKEDGEEPDEDLETVPLPHP
jgi:hypothetical protein